MLLASFITLRLHTLLSLTVSSLSPPAASTLPRPQQELHSLRALLKQVLVTQ